MLSPAGRLLGDLSVTRLDDDRFWLTGSYYLQAWHGRWFAQHLPERGVATGEHHRRLDGLLGVGARGTDDPRRAGARRRLERGVPDVRRAPDGRRQRPGGGRADRADRRDRLRDRRADAAAPHALDRPRRGRRRRTGCVRSATARSTASASRRATASGTRSSGRTARRARPGSTGSSRSTRATFIGAEAAAPRTRGRRAEASRAAAGRRRGCRRREGRRHLGRRHAGRRGHVGRLRAHRRDEPGARVDRHAGGRGEPRSSRCTSWVSRRRPGSSTRCRSIRPASACAAEPRRGSVLQHRDAAPLRLPTTHAFAQRAAQGFEPGYHARLSRERRTRADEHDHRGSRAEETSFHESDRGVRVRPDRGRRDLRVRDPEVRGLRRRLGGDEDPHPAGVLVAAGGHDLQPLHVLAGERGGSDRHGPRAVGGRDADEHLGRQHPARGRRVRGWRDRRDAQHVGLHRR